MSKQGKKEKAIFSNWKVAGGLRFYNEITSYIKQRKNFYQMEDSLISSVYDTHCGLKWNGGRGSLPFFWSIDESIRGVNDYNDMGVSFYAAFNNTLLQEKDLDDEKCNYFLEKIHNSQNGVIVASDILKDYLRKNYPKFKIVASICFCEKDIKEYERRLEEYDMVALHPDLNRDLSFIIKINEGKRNNLEVLVNEHCIANCIHREKHYKKISKKQLKEEYVCKHEDYDKCYVNKKRNKINKMLIKRTNGRRRGQLVLMPKEVGTLLSLGIRNFKICGRDAPNFNDIERSIVDYIEKPTIRNLLHSDK